MTPFHFGTHQRRLFGIYEPAHQNLRKQRAVLICYPMGNEQIFAYRTMRQLAARLARVGFHVLRFDYFGTGDSYGETGEGGIARWCEDIETAIEELRDVTGVTKVSLVGLRLGANLSARVAANRPQEISKLIVWEPLMIDELAGLGDPALRADRSPRSTGTDAAGDPARIDISFTKDLLPPNTLVLLTTRRASAAEFGTLTVDHLAGASPWIEDRIDTGSIPAEVLQHIVNWLE